MNNQRNVELVFLPVSVYQAMQARGLAPQAMGRIVPETISKLSQVEIATILAFQEFGPLVKAIGQSGRFVTDYKALSNKDYELLQAAQSVSQSDFISQSLYDQVSGDASGDTAAMEVVDLDVGVIGVVCGRGTVDALRKDNNVLALLEAVVQRALSFDRLENVLKGNIAAATERFMHVNAFANTISRPPTPVYR